MGFVCTCSKEPNIREIQDKPTTAMGEGRLRRVVSEWLVAERLTHAWGKLSSIRQNRTMINTRWPRSEDVQHCLCHQNLELLGGCERQT